MTPGEALGFVGGLLITSGFVPQLLRVYRLRSAREISLAFTILFILGAISWLSYGIVLDLPSVIFWNAVNLLLVIGLLFAKLKYGNG